MKNTHSFIGIVLRGMAMGAADVVPGVSGGTMALITGIYERLISAVAAISSKPLSLIRKHGISVKTIQLVWKSIDGTFLTAVAIGVGISILSLARLVHWALEEYPPIVWALFFGLIVASAVYVGKQVQPWKLNYVIITIVSAGLLVIISRATPVSTPETWWFIVLSGVIAISAMILPGISGSFLLVMLGKYTFILEAVREFQLDVLIIFAIGCAVGIVTSARIIAWLFAKYHNATMAAIVGVMVGSLYKVWPWRVVTSYSGVPGEDAYRVINDAPVLPNVYAIATAYEPFVLGSIVACITGMVVVWVISRYTNAD